MSRITLDQANCKSCGYCVNACRPGALFISDLTNEGGYHVVAVHEEKCIGCGICYTVCPDYVINIFDAEKGKGEAG